MLWTLRNSNKHKIKRTYFFIVCYTTHHSSVNNTADLHAQWIQLQCWVTPVSYYKITQSFVCKFHRLNRMSQWRHLQKKGLMYILTLLSHTCHVLTSSFLPSGFLIKTLHAFLLSVMHATCPIHVSLLDFTTLIILVIQYQPWSFSLWNFLCWNTKATSLPFNWTLEEGIP